MAISRHMARAVAMQILYEREMRSGDLEQQIAENMERYKYKPSEKNMEFVQGLVLAVEEKRPEIWLLLEKYAKERPIKDIAILDRIIIEMGAYELVYHAGEVPAAVVINEAVELAKEYSVDPSHRFVNGVLNGIYKGAGEKEKK